YFSRNAATVAGSSMARWPSAAAAGSPGTSWVRVNATRVMPRTSRTPAMRRRPMSASSGCRYSMARRGAAPKKPPPPAPAPRALPPAAPAASGPSRVVAEPASTPASMSAAAPSAPCSAGLGELTEVHGPHQVVLQALQRLRGQEHLGRLDQRHHRSFVQLLLELLVQGGPLGGVRFGQRRLHRRLDLRVAAFLPVDPLAADHAAGPEGQVVAGVRVVRTPQPDADLLLAATGQLQHGGDRCTLELGGDPGVLQVGLDPGGHVG